MRWTMTWKNETDYGLKGMNEADYGLKQINDNVTRVEVKLSDVMMWMQTNILDMERYVLGQALMLKKMSCLPILAKSNFFVSVRF